MPAYWLPWPGKTNAVSCSMRGRIIQSLPMSLEKLVCQLQGAYSGELAAGYAYRGHWHSVRDTAERERIRAIEAEEWHHRELVGAMLRDLGARPNWRREVVFYCIGKCIAGICHIGGWFVPMYGAGRLERNNIVEYEDAAVYAAACGHEELVDCLLAMDRTSTRLNSSHVSEARMPSSA